MKIVIDIPEELLNKCIFGGAPTMSPVDKARCINKISHGKPLPKDHGRLIDADVLAAGVRCAICRNINKSDRGCDGACKYDNWVLNSIETLIDHTPTIYATEEPEKQMGHWLKDRGSIYRCSNCGNFLDFNGVNAGRGDANYCPNCGAGMRRDYDN